TARTSTTGAPWDSRSATAPASSGATSTRCHTRSSSVAAPLSGSSSRMPAASARSSISCAGIGCAGSASGCWEARIRGSGRRCGRTTTRADRPAQGWTRAVKSLAQGAAASRSGHRCPLQGGCTRDRCGRRRHPRVHAGGEPVSRPGSAGAVRPQAGGSRVVTRYIAAPPIREEVSVARVVMYASVSVDGFIADENDQPGPLFDWLTSGDVPLDDSGVLKVSQASYDHTRPYWNSIGVTIAGRHVFDLTDGWDG